VIWFICIRPKPRYTCEAGLIAEGIAVKSIWQISFVVAFMFSEPGFAQKLVDPNAVAPEYREAAEKRRAEQIKQRECAHKADEAKVLARDRTAHITKCLAEDAPNPTTASAHQ
jgi:hypothetical protein